MPKRVCIIGAGPAGLVAAKTLTHDHAGYFHVTIVEQSHRIGGLWPTSKIDNGMVNPDMCTNQSKHTVSFSDLAWSAEAPDFPKAWMVGMYLERYIETYPRYDIRLNTKVLKTEERGGKWKVDVQEKGKEEEEIEFDHVIVATGFFGKPKMPELEELQIPVLHSSEVRKLEEVLRHGRKKKIEGGGERKIVVVGGQMSGVETASSIAFQLSSEVKSPSESGILDVDKYSVVHIVQKPVWVMPLFFPSNPDLVQADASATKKKNAAPKFLPLDLVNYNLSWRPPGPVQNTSGHISVDGAKMVHGFMETYIGDDQSQLGTPHLSMAPESIREEPPLLACSDGYTEFVRAGNIKVVQGKLKSASSLNPSSIEISDGKETTTIEDVAAIICATGFDASPSVNFLQSEILSDLKFAPNDDTFPLALNVHASTSKQFPSLGFVGFYRSPYWGVMEMQARFLGKLWSGDKKATEALEQDVTIDAMLKLRTDPRRAQFPMGDYAYLMESFREILEIKRVEPAPPKAEGERTGIVLPARYLPSTANEKEKSESAKELEIIDRVFDQSETKGRYVARAVFRGLQGVWHLERKIDSQLSSFPSGNLRGTASFSPREPTDENADQEYLYSEEGDFKTSWGGTMSAKRSYIYHYVEAKDKLDVWFAKQDYKTQDYLFHELEFIVPAADENKEVNEGWKARASHLCIEDLYDVNYEFRFKGTVIESWKSRYVVKGPKKDYTIENLYTRAEKEMIN